MSVKRAANFSAGPGVLPVEVLEKAREEMLSQAGSGMSVMEMSHRSKPYDAIQAAAEADARAFLGIPDSHAVLFLQGGASLQFTMIPKNLGGGADFVTTGSWGQKAIEAARLEGAAQEIWTGKADKFRSAPDLTALDRTEGAAYTHITLNETIQGVDYMTDPPADGTDWVCDMSSTIGSRKMDFSRYALVYAGAQKNIGPAGLTLVVIRKDLLERVPEGVPPMLDFRIQAENDSRYNTPPCWSIYMAGLVFRHWLDRGGIEAVEAANEAKAAVLYGAIDGSARFYRGHAVEANRSRMNVPFVLGDDSLTDPFLKEAKEHGFLELKGHRSVGGCRASIYNAQPAENVKALADFMADFAQRKG
ncbi:MAG: 3-phosphoserine/phosphohydroxythreonine transaminase [Fimbriimonadaceae bacterium]|nr:3-phosphoserine/phosphohydroxythreonine transaminase [Fimbriimonadaceae bacterium]